MTSDLWKKLIAKAKEIAKEERRKNMASSGGVVAMIKRGVEKRKKEEEEKARQAAADAEKAKAMAAAAKTEADRKLAEEALRLAEEEQKRALEMVADLQEQLEKAEKKLNADAAAEDEFEDKIFDEKQSRAILRAQIAKAEKKRARRRAKTERGKEWLRRASCEFRTDGHYYKKRTLSVEEEKKLNKSLTQSLVEKKVSNLEHLDWADLRARDDDDDKSSIDEVTMANNEIERQRALREQQKAKKEQERKERLSGMQARLDAEKNKALEMAKEAEAKKRAKEEADAEYARRLAAAGGDASVLALEDAKRAKEEAAQAEALAASRGQFRGRSGSLITMESSEDAMTKLRTAKSVQEMAEINYLSYVGASQLEFVDEKKQRAKELEQEEIRIKLAEKKGQKIEKRIRSPRKTHELSPRKRPLNGPPSPTKQKLGELRKERGEEKPTKIDRPLSPERLEKINSSFKESDRLRQEARSNITNFNAKLDNAKQYLGGTKTTGRPATEEVLPAYMNRWYTEMAFVPPHHMHGEDPEIIKLQYHVAQAKNILSKVHNKNLPLNALGSIAAPSISAPRVRTNSFSELSVLDALTGGVDSGVESGADAAKQTVQFET